MLPDLRLELHAQERDEALPALDTLVQPRAVAELLEPVLHEAGYDGARIASCEPVVARYKPGSRCTVVVHLRYAGSSRTVPCGRQGSSGRQGPVGVGRDERLVGKAGGLA